MKVLGLNAGQSAPHPVDPTGLRRLADGASALVEDGSVRCAVIEERVAGQRYVGGYVSSAPIVLSHSTSPERDVDVIAISTCCDRQWTAAEARDHLMERGEGGMLRVGKGTALVTVDHHASHAMLAFLTLPQSNEPTLVCVMDGMGNVPDSQAPFDTTDAWWYRPYRRQSYYLASWRDGRVRLELVAEDSRSKEEIGLGELYRALSHYLGWPSYQYAGKSMALAAYGDPGAMARATFVEPTPDGTWRVTVKNDHPHPFDQICRTFRAAGYDLPNHVAKGAAGPHHRPACDVAARVQAQVEAAVVGTVQALCDRHGVRQVAFGGGVALNCVALGRLSHARPDLKLAVPSAPADTGQALGNAFWSSLCCESANSQPLTARWSGLDRCDFGPDYPEVQIQTEIAEFSKWYRGLEIQQLPQDRLADATVDLLAQGMVIGIRHGRSEYGPRALGHSSIVADPRSREMHDTVNYHKQREPFRPYAPSILQEATAEWLGTRQPSPFMSFAAWWQGDCFRRVAAVAHADQSARYQTVAKGYGFYRELIERFDKRTGVPVVLNTSFNVNGQAIVETPLDALSAFRAMHLDALVLGNHLITRTQPAELEKD